MDGSLHNFEQNQCNIVGVLNRAKTETAFKNTIQRIVGDLGFTNFDITHFKNNTVISIILHTLPQSMIESYYAEGLHENELSNEYFNDSRHSVYHSAIHEHFSNSPVTTNKIEKAHRIDTLFKDFGFHDAYSCPIDNERSGKLILTVYSQNVTRDEFKQATKKHNAMIKKLAKAINDVFYQSEVEFISKFSNEMDSNMKTLISILEAYGKLGLTTNQVADHLGFTVGTVGAYRARIMKLFSKPTMAGALYEAIKLGYLTIDIHRST
jgi:hypothetical protein